jgi:hypothetical protein
MAPAHRGLRPPSGYWSLVLSGREGSQLAASACWDHIAGGRLGVPQNLWNASSVTGNCPAATWKPNRDRSPAATRCQRRPDSTQQRHGFPVSWFLSGGGTGGSQRQRLPDGDPDFRTYRSPLAGLDSDGQGTAAAHHLCIICGTRAPDLIRKGWRGPSREQKISARCALDAASIKFSQGRREPCRNMKMAGCITQVRRLCEGHQGITCRDPGSQWQSSRMPTARTPPVYGLTL